MRYTFADVVMDTARRELHRGGEELSIEPKVFDVLALLVENADRMLTKEEMLDTIWGDRFVSESALSSRIKLARQALGDNGRDQKVIKTMHGRGFRLIVDVRVDVRVDSAPETGLETETRQSNLPRRRARLHGRDAELRRTVESVRSRDLVSIVGTGGVGKTSLALEVGHAMADELPGGVWLCELARAHEGSVAAMVIGSLLDNAGTGQSSVKEVAEALPTERTLLILDNCEHLIDESATFVSQLLDRSRQVCVLTTSREALDLRGEQVVRLDGLEHASLQAPAVEMFLERAGEIADIGDDVATRETVKAIVSRIEGLPLAIELAAPRLVSSSPRELLEALEDQLSVLASRRRHGDRQSAMDRAIGWSFDLLADDEKDLLCDLGVFASPFTRSAVESVASDGIATGRGSIDRLHRLVEQSMVSSSGAGATMRFRLLEPIRQFVSRQSERALAADLQERHAHYFAQRVSALAKDLYTVDQPVAAETLTNEWPDVGRAMAWGRENQLVEVAIDPLLDLGLHLMWQQRLEAFDWLREARSLLPDHMGARQRSLEILMAFAAWDWGDRELAIALLEKIQADGVDGESQLLASCLDMTGNDVPQLVVSTRVGLDAAEERNDPVLQAVFASYNLIALSLAGSDNDVLDVASARVHRHIERHYSPTALSWGLLAHLTRAVLAGDTEATDRLRGDVFQLAADCRTPWYAQIAGSLTHRSKPGHVGEVERLGEAVSSMRGTVESKRSSHYSLTFRTGVVALVNAGQYVVAAQLVGLIQNLESASAILDRLSGGFSDALELANDTLGPEELERLIAIGRRLTPEQGVALAETGLEVASA